MSDSRPISPSNGAPGASTGAAAPAGPAPTYMDYQNPGSGLMPFHPAGSMLFFPPHGRSSFQFNNWPSSMGTDPSSLGSLSHRTSVDEITHFPSLSNDNESNAHGGSFSGFPGAPTSGSVPHAPFLSIPLYPDSRSGMSFMTSSSETPISRDSQSSVSGPNSGLPPGSQPSQHHQSHDKEADHIGGESHRIMTPRGSWLFGPSGIPPPLSNSATPAGYRPSTSPSDSSLQHQMGLGGSGFGSGHVPFSSFPLYYPLEFRSNSISGGGGSISAASTRSETEETTREDANSESANYGASGDREPFEDQLDDDSLEADMFEEEDLSSPRDPPPSSTRPTRPRSKRSGAVAARASLAGRVQTASASSLSHLGAGGSAGNVGSGDPRSEEHLSGLLSHQIHHHGNSLDRHRGTGRKKIDIKPISSKLKRQITFSKRKTGLLKKVKELTTLTQTDALVILVSETGNPHSFATDRFRHMIRNADTRTLNGYLDAEEKRSKGHK